MKQFITRLKNTSFYSVLLNNYFLIAIGVLLLLLTLNYFYAVIILLIYIVYLFKASKTKKSNIILWVLVVILLLVLFSFFINSKISKDAKLIEVKGIVTNIEKREWSNKLLVKRNLKKYIVYDYEKKDIRIGDKIEAKGENVAINSNYNEFEFNYQRYCLSKKIVSIIKADSINYKKDYNIFLLRRVLYNYIEKQFDEESLSYIKGFVFGDTKSFDEETVKSIQTNGISHLFAISGLHITLLVSILSRLLLKLGFKEEKSEIIIITFLFVYLVITYFAISIMRASFMYALGVLNKRLKLKFSSLDIFSHVFIVFVIINPLVMYDLSFILSFCASFFIIVLSETINKIDIKHKLNETLKLFITTLSLQIITLPITINLNNSFNIVSPIINVFFITIVTSVILPLTFLTLMFPFIFKGIYKYIIYGFSFLINKSSSLLNISISLPSFEMIEIILFYLLVVLFLICKRKKTMITLFLIFLFSYYNKAKLNVNGEIYFMALSEGDSTIVNYPFNKGVVVIDTGTSETDEVYSSLVSMGIRKIDYLILTHNHADHNGGARKILENISVTTVVVSSYDNSVFSKRSNTLIATVGTEIKINDSIYNVLSPKKKSDNENDNSLVIKANIGKFNYLFLGDASKSIEEDLIDYNLDVDIVKVGHHGSPTSTSEAFYNSIKPEYVIIETGRVEYFNFPNKKVIDTLANYNIYRTDIHYQIKIIFSKKKSIIKTLK